MIHLSLCLMELFHIISNNDEYEFKQRKSKIKINNRMENKYYKYNFKYGDVLIEKQLHFNKRYILTTMFPKMVPKFDLTIKIMTSKGTIVEININEPM